jgi:hypothetical protein
MLKKQYGLGQLLLRYWFVILLALIIFAYVSGFLPQQITKIEHSLRKKSKTTESVTDSLYKAEQGKERQEILKY